MPRCAATRRRWPPRLRTQTLQPPRRRPSGSRPGTPCVGFPARAPALSSRQGGTAALAASRAAGGPRPPAAARPAGRSAAAAAPRAAPPASARAAARRPPPWRQPWGPLHGGRPRCGSLHWSWCSSPRPLPPPGVATPWPAAAGRRCPAPARSGGHQWPALAPGWQCPPAPSLWPKRRPAACCWCFPVATQTSFSGAHQPSGAGSTRPVVATASAAPQGQPRAASCWMSPPWQSGSRSHVGGEPPVHQLQRALRPSPPLPLPAGP